MIVESSRSKHTVTGSGSGPGATGPRGSQAGEDSAATPVVRVLVADDHPIVRSGIVALLAAHPAIDVVGEAGDGQTAVDLAIELRPDVVLMDLQMPRLTGAEATERILRHDPTRRVLVLTTFETDDQILAAISAGASGYLLKAAPEDEIVTGILSAARGDTVLAPSIAASLVASMRRDSTPAPRLSPRETSVLQLVAAGRSNPEIARELFIGEATVKTHLLHVFEKLGVSDRTRAVTLALELGLLPR